jgi:hypothetical protein
MTDDGELRDPGDECTADKAGYGDCDGPVQVYAGVDGLGLPVIKPRKLCQRHAFILSNGEM